MRAARVCRTASTPGVVLHARVAPWRVRDVYVRTPVDVAGASLAAGAPGAVEQAGELLAPGCGADDWVRREIGGQSADGRIDVQRHQEEEGRAAGRRDECQRRCGVEVEPLTAGTPWRSAPRSAEPELQQFAMT